MEAYKNISRTGTISDIDQAFSDIQSLAEECREAYDNMESGNLGQTQRCQTFGETADALESISEVDIPDCLNDVAINYHEQVQTIKGRGTSRAVRLENSLDILRSTIDSAQEYMAGLDSAASEDTTEQEDEIQEFIEEIENIISEVEGVEFPGMFG